MLRWWDGNEWTDHTSTPSITKTGRDEAAITAAVLNAVSQGWRIEHRTSNSAVLVSGSRPNHVLHLLLTVFTLGLWGIVWIVIGLAGGERRRMVLADGFGNLHWR